jgi:O-methyltransferase
MEALRVSMREVARGFQDLGLWDRRVHFHRGYFADACPKLRPLFQERRIAVLRMDGDMYESTFDILFNL